MDNKYLKIIMGLFLSITLVVNPFLAQPSYAETKYEAICKALLDKIKTSITGAPHAC